MIMKCRDMDRVMAAISQKLLHGGIRNRDWFSDKLEKQTDISVVAYTEKRRSLCLMVEKFRTC